MLGFETLSEAPLSTLPTAATPAARTFFMLPNLNGLGIAGPAQFNPSLEGV